MTPSLSLTAASDPLWVREIDSIISLEEALNKRSSVLVFQTWARMKYMRKELRERWELIEGGGIGRNV